MKSKYWNEISGKVKYYCQEADNNKALYRSTKLEYDIAVSCCNCEDDECDIATVTGWRRQGTSHPKTLQEAYDICTLPELVSGKTAGLGQSYDYAFNWSSDHCIRWKPQLQNFPYSMLTGDDDYNGIWKRVQDGYMKAMLCITRTRAMMETTDICGWGMAATRGL